MFLALLPLLPVLSCGGNSSPANTVTPPSACLEFAPAADPAPGTVVAREGGATTCDRLAVDLIIADVDDLFTVDFKLSFDPDVLRYTGYDETNSVLASDGEPVTVIDNEQDGVISFTITRFGALLGGIDVSGSQFLVRINFAREVDAGVSPLSFSNERLWNSAFPLEQIQGVEWHGGTVTIR
jgi:hypothetical protein